MRIITIFLFTFLLTSCGGWVGDSIEELPGTYEFVFEGGDYNYIYGGVKNEKVIPCKVESYNYDKDYIIAYQKASKNCVIEHNVKQEEGSLYYWVIDVKADTLYSFSNKSDYLEKRKELGVPEELKFDRDASGNTKQ